MHLSLAPRRLAIVAVVVLGVFALVGGLAAGSGRTEAAKGAVTPPLCVLHSQLCTEANSPWSWNGYNYISGHDEPSLLFYSNKEGSGNSNNYQLTLPTDAPTPPAQDASGGTWNFMLHPAFWFGMAMCDDQSAPNPGVPCKADSDKNIYTGTDPSKKDYLGNTPGSAFMEMQFYPPGWGGFGVGVSCGPNNHQWCAALTIDSFSSNSNTGVANNSNCLNQTGIEYVNYAIITKSGNSQGPADPLNQTAATFATGADTLEMNAGDQLTVSMHDTKAGFQVLIHDLTTGETGSMTASIANGFGHPLYQPNASTCTDEAYAFHPMYSTSSPDTRVLWAAHSYNVAFSDEIGHFEYCNALTSSNGGSCAASSFPDPSDGTKDNDDRGCYNLPVVQGSPPTTLVPSFIGCLASDGDFDGPEYQNGTWPGSPNADPTKVSAPIVFSSPTFGDGEGKQYSQVAFETDLPRIEGTDSAVTNPPNNFCQRHLSNPADPSPGAGCVDPPNGASFYPIFSTTGSKHACLWQEGGAAIPGTTNNFGGAPGVEYGALLVSNYPVAGPSVSQRLNNFHNTLDSNPCPQGK
ncbi:MAG: hypothetical protein ACJ75L_03305 [Gaiellaceae bacterium]